MSFWFKASSLSVAQADERTLFAYGGDFQLSMIRRDDDGVLKFVMPARASEDSEFFANAPDIDGVWFHIVLVFVTLPRTGTTPNAIDLYLNGTVLRSIGATNLNTAAPGQIIWGADAQGRNADVQLADARVYDFVLDADQVRRLWNDGCPSYGQDGMGSPQGWWFFNEGAGNIASDHSGNHNDATLYNAPAWLARLPLRAAGAGPGHSAATHRADRASLTRSRHVRAMRLGVGRCGLAAARRRLHVTLRLRRADRGRRRRRRSYHDRLRAARTVRTSPAGAAP